MYQNRTLVRALLSAVLMIVVLSNTADLTAAPVLIVDDPVEPSDGWTIVDGTFGNGFGLTSPIEGDNLYNLAGASAESASKNFASSPESVGKYWFWEDSEVVVQGGFNGFVGAKAV